MTQIDTTISAILDRHKPDGTRWAVLATEPEGYKAVHGPFETYDAAMSWSVVEASTGSTTEFEVLPLYTV